MTFTESNTVEHMILEAASVGLKNILVREKKPRIWVNHLGKNWEALSPDPCVETLVMDADVLNATLL
jgi:hypothetical protein